MRQADFLMRLGELLEAEVEGWDAATRAEVLRAAGEGLRVGGRAPTCRVVPFVTGRRPTDEVRSPFLGSSDNAALVLGDRSSQNMAYLLYTVAGVEGDGYAIDATLRFAGPNGAVTARPIPGWERRPVEPRVMERDGEGRPVLRGVPLAEGSRRRLVLEISPEDDLLPGRRWFWDELDPALTGSATDASDPFTFGHLFSQVVQVELRLTRAGLPVAVDQAELDVCDLRRFGSLYDRVVERIVKPDSERQARAAGVGEPGHAYHPWYPVLLIGSDKAALYTRALVDDIVHKKHHLTDPRWLMRVGLYLELLTCVGIFEAVKDDLGDLLTPAERAAFETSPLYAQIRRRLNREGWREVWTLRGVALPVLGVPNTGPVSALNLLAKKRATLRFLQVHHQDLMHAIELAGANHHNAQETWHRVFRDAERAVLRKTAGAFPELGFLPAGARDFALWHQKGRWNLEGALGRVAPVLGAVVGDWDGLYPSACHEYRASMNHVAEWAKGRGLMEYTGSECVPEQVSLFEAYLAGGARLGPLQRRDGYAEQLDATPLPEEYERSTEDVASLVAGVPLFELLTVEEQLGLATTGRCIAVGPMERILIEGREGSSLFIVVDGTMEVLVRQPDGVDLPVATMGRGAVIGEMSLLTGERRCATVRAVDGAVVYEVGRAQYEPLVRDRPELVNELARLMEERLRERQARLEAYDAEAQRTALGARIRSFLFGG